MTDEQRRLADELFDRICKCLDFDSLDLKFTVHRTKGKWLNMTIHPVDGDGHVVFDLEKLVRTFAGGGDGNYFAGHLHLAQDNKLVLIGRVMDDLFQVTFRPLSPELVGR